MFLFLLQGSCGEKIDAALQGANPSQESTSTTLTFLRARSLQTRTHDLKAINAARDTSIKK